LVSSPDLLADIPRSLIKTPSDALKKIRDQARRTKTLVASFLSFVDQVAS